MPVGRRLRVTSVAANAGLHPAVDWLVTNEPPATQTVVCHGDLHPLNLLARGTHVCAVIDWTTARLANPASDVACTSVLVAQAPLAAPAVAQPALRAVGRTLARRLVKHYRARMNLDDDQLRWHEAWQCTRLLAEVADNRLAGTNKRAHPFETSAAEIRHQLQHATGIDVALSST